MTTTRARNVVIAYATLCLLPSTTWIAIKIGLGGTPPLLGAGLRFLVAWPCLIAFRLASGGSLRVPRQAFPLLISLAVLMFALPYGLIYSAETRLTSSLSALLYGSMPLFVVIVANRARPREPLTRGKLIGVVVGIAGLVIVFGGELALSTAAGSVLSMCAVVVAAASTAWMQVASRRATQLVPLSVLIGWASGLAGLGLVLLGSVVQGGHLTVDARTVGSALYLGVTAAAAFAAMLWLLGRIGAVYVSLHALVVPLLALVWGVAFYGDTFTASLGVGAAVVAVGVGLVTADSIRGRRRSPTPTAPDLGRPGSDELSPGSNLLEQL